MFSVAQLVERLLLISEVRGSNPVIGKNLFIFNICLVSTVYWKDETKEKEAGNDPFLKNVLASFWVRAHSCENLHFRVTSSYKQIPAPLGVSGDYKKQIPSQIKQMIAANLSRSITWSNSNFTPKFRSICRSGP